MRLLHSQIYREPLSPPTEDLVFKRVTIHIVYSKQSRIAWRMSQEWVLTNNVGMEHLQMWQTVYIILQLLQ